MKYLIDSANKADIDQALKQGINGVTANPSMYAQNNISMEVFLQYYSNKDLHFLSGEVMGGTLDELLAEVEAIQQINKEIIIKVNFSAVGLELCTLLAKRKVKTAMTLVFTIPQAIAAIQVGVDYLFPFIGRNDEYGNNGMQFVKSLQKIVTEKNYSTKVVAASIKNLHQLEELAVAGVDYAAIPYELYLKSLHHPLTESGKLKFENDWSSIK